MAQVTNEDRERAVQWLLAQGWDVEDVEAIAQHGADERERVQKEMVVKYAMDLTRVALAAKNKGLEDATHELTRQAWEDFRDSTIARGWVDWAKKVVSSLKTPPSGETTEDCLNCEGRHMEDCTGFPCKMKPVGGEGA